MKDHHISRSFSAINTYLGLNTAVSSTFTTSAAFLPSNFFESPLITVPGGGGSYDPFLMSEVIAPNCSWVGSYAFDRCPSLENVSFPVCKSIYSRAFACCGLHSITTATFPSVEFIDDWAFRWCSNLSLISLSTYNPMSMSYGVFADCQNLKSVYLANCVKVSDHIFSGCTNLETVVMPDFFYGEWPNLGLFYGTLPPLMSTGNFRYIETKGGKVLYSCLSNVYQLPANTGAIRCAIGNSYLSNILSTNAYDVMTAFYNNTYLTSVNLTNPSVVLTMNAFNGCTNLQSVSIPYFYGSREESYWAYDKRTLSIPDSIFYNCNKLSNIYLPNWTGTQIGSYAFYNCSSLSDISFLSNCSAMGPYAFAGCSALHSISFPKCTYIANYAFSNTTINSAYLPLWFSSSTLYSTSVTNVFTLAKSTLTNLTIGASMLSNSAFYYFYALQTIVLPYCRSIGYSAFANCSALSNIILTSNSLCSLYSSMVFYSAGITSTSGNIIVPKSLVSSYQSAYGWSYFFNRIVPEYTVISCNSLSITADDCSGNDTTTTIHYTASVYVLYYDGTYRTIDEKGDATSADFGTNPSTTQSRQVTITYTYMDKTATTTITQSPYVAKSYSITTSGITSYGYTKDTSVLVLDQTVYDGPYKSNNYNINSSYAVARIDFTGYTEFTIWLNSYAESSFDYAIAGKLDSTYPTTNSAGYASNGYSTTMSSSSGKYSNTGNYQKSPSTSLTEATWRKITYTTDGGSHYIYITYRKDGSVKAGNDRGYFVVVK